MTSIHNRIDSVRLQRGDLRFRDNDQLRDYLYKQELSFDTIGQSRDGQDLFWRHRRPGAAECFGDCWGVMRMSLSGR